MRHCKRLLCLLLVTFLMFGSVSVNAFAADSDGDSKPVISVESKTVNAGDSFSVNVDIKNNPGILGATLTFNYDEGLTLDGAEAGEAFSFLTMTKPGKMTSPCKFSWDGQSIEDESVVKDGTFLVLNFTAAVTLTSLANLNISVDTSEGVYDNDLQPLDVETENGKITVIDYTPGDVNTDKKINPTDVVLVRRHIVGGYDVNINTRAANVNGDQKINSADVICIRRHIAGGYNIVLQPSEDICSHVMEPAAYKAATCTEPGNIAYWHCTVCDKYYSDANGTHEIAQADTVIPANGHTVVIDPAVEPTADKPGLTEGSHCSVCNTVIVPQREWTINTYTIKYNVSNGDNYLAAQTIENDNPATIAEGGSSYLKDLEVKGYQFLGWYDGAGDDAAKVTRITDADHSYTLYAHWKKISYQVQFESNLYPIDSIEYTIDKGAVLPKPSLSNYVFVAWTDEEGNVFDRSFIPAGTAENIHLKANWTSERNRCYTKKTLDDPIIIDDDNDVLFVYEIGKIQNVPLYTIKDFGYISGEGVTRTEESSYTTTITDSVMDSYNKAVANATTKSRSWTLSEGWSESTTYNESWKKENETKEGWSETAGRSDTGTWNISKGTGGSSSKIIQDTSSTNDYNASSAIEHDYSNGSSSQYFNAEVNTSSKTGVNTNFNVGLSSKLTDVFTKEKGSSTDETGSSAGAGFGASLELGTNQGTSHGNTSSGYSESGNLTTENSSKNVGNFHNESSETTGSWNSNSSYGGSSTISSSQTKYGEVTDRVSHETGYGKTYVSDKNVNNTEGHSFYQADSEEYAASTVYSKADQETVTSSWTTQGTKPGYHRWIVAGTMHVFGAVGYNYATKSFYVNTYSLMDDEQHEFEDYSYTTPNYDDNQNGVISFEIPVDIMSYVMDKTQHSQGLVVNQDTGFVEGYTGTDDLVIVPELYPVFSHTESGIDYYDNVRITGITSGAFKGNEEIQGVVLPDTVTEIPDEAFMGCTSLWKVYGGGITSIGAHSFKDCTSIMYAFLTPNVTSLGTGAYENVDNLYIGLANEAVAQGAAQSGADRITMFATALTDHVGEFRGKSISIPDTASYFEFNGYNLPFSDLSIVSDAQKTVLNKTKISDAVHLPLRISSPDVVLNQVEVNTKGIAAALTADNTNLALQSTVRMNTECPDSMLVKTSNLSAFKEDIIGTLAVSGSLDVCGALEGTDHLQQSGDEIRSIDSTEFEALLNAGFIALDPDGGECGSSYIFADPGQPLGELPVPTKECYNFAGWYLEDGTQLTDATVLSAGESHRAVANWTLKEYTVSWESGTGRTITVNRTASLMETAPIGTLASGDTVYHGDTLSVSYSAAEGFDMNSHGEEELTVAGNITSSEIFADVSPKQYKVSWNNVGNCTITVTRKTSPYKNASTGGLSNGAAIYYGDTLQITYSPASGYQLTSQGKTSVNVTANVTASDIRATVEPVLYHIRTSNFSESNCPYNRMRSHIEIYNRLGKLYIKGWVYDTAHPEVSCRIDVNSQFAADANKANSACPVSGNHGFEIECSVEKEEERIMVHTFLTVDSGNPVKLWDALVNHKTHTYRAAELDP